MKAGTTSQTGFSDPTERLSYGVRAHEPDPSPDGRTVVFVSNHRGTRYLQLGEVQEGEGPSLGKIRSLVPSERTDQAYTPRFSPDGTHVAYSVFRRGGYRDIRYVDVRTGTFEEIAHDRAQDGAPSFSADGKYVLFHSDRTGIPNVYAWEIESKKLFQVTNVIMGAF
jgi:tricorn protease-like protein